MTDNTSDTKTDAVQSTKASKDAVRDLHEKRERVFRSKDETDGIDRLQEARDARTNASTGWRGYAPKGGKASDVAARQDTAADLATDPHTTPKNRIEPPVPSNEAGQIDIVKMKETMRELLGQARPDKCIDALVIVYQSQGNVYTHIDSIAMENLEDSMSVLGDELAEYVNMYGNDEED